MSYCAYIRTASKLEPQSLFKTLADKGEQIVITSDKFPCLKFGTFKYALRGVEVNLEDDGYEVRICSMGSMADYQLFPKVVCAVQELTGGNVYDEDDDETPLKDPKKRFGLKWRREQTEASWNVTCALIKHMGEPVIFEGIFAPFVIGKNILEAYSIDMDNPTGGEDYKRLEYLLFTNQWGVKEMTSTATQLAIANPKDEDKKLGISMISLKDGKVCNFEYVSYADLVCVMNQDNKDMALARFKHLNRILPVEKFQPIDELQYILKESLTKEDFEEMLAKAKTYQEDDFFAESSWKGMLFNGDVQYISVSGYQLAIPEELKKTKEGAKLGEAKAPAYLLWADDFNLFFSILPCVFNETIADKETAIMDARKEMKDNMGLIEVEDGKTGNGSSYCYSLIKGKEQTGVIYFLSILVQSGNDIIHVVCNGTENGITGQRDATVFELERRDNNVRIEANGVVGWNSDPYDKAITTGFLMNLSEQAKYDSMFPTHPLSLLRELARFIIEKN